MTEDGLPPTKKVEPMLENRRVWTQAIVVSVIASAIFLLFMEPLLRALRSLVLGAGGWLLSSLIDSSYNDAVVGTNAQDAFFSFSILMMAMTLFAALLYLRIIFGDRRSIDQRVDIVTKIFAVVMILLVPTTAGALTLRSVSLAAHTSFERRMMALAPLASETEKNALVGQWARITTRSQYNAVMKAMDQVAARHGSTLPSPSV